MFSSRTNWYREPNRLARTLHELRVSGREIIDLTLSNPTDAGLVYPGKEIMESLSYPDALLYKPDPFGLLSAREAIAEYYGAKGIGISPADILLTAGSSEAYAFLFTLLCEAGDNVLVPNPTYPLFEFLAQLHDIVVQPYQLGYDGEWHVDTESVRKAILATTRAIILVNPHNPTGMFLKREELQAMNEIAARNNLSLIVDEVFADYPFGTDGARVSSTASNADEVTFTLNGISKMCGLPQLKLGWIVVSGKEELKREALHRLEIIADTFLSVNTPVQLALPRLMQIGQMIRKQIKERVEQNLSFLKGSLNKNSPVSLLNSEGGWYAILKIPNIKTEEEWALQLLEEGSVYVFPGYFFEFQESGYLVLSLLPEVELFRTGVQQITRLVK